MSALDDLPTPKPALIAGLVEQLATIPGMVAVVLGGSYARGAGRPDSDVDLGLYYREASPFSPDDLRRIAEPISTSMPVVTGFYEWGPWVNGGAWIHTRAGKVDFLYRNIDQVERVIRAAHQGKATLDYLQQPPYGFHSVIYLAETSICRPLYDPEGIIAGLKQNVQTYPPLLKQRVIQDSLWNAEFTLANAQGMAQRGEVYTTVGCLTRAFNFMTHALFALNETYFIADKGAMVTIEGFALKPPDYAASVARMLAHPGATADQLTVTLDAARTLLRACIDLAGSLYTARFIL